MQAPLRRILYPLSIGLRLAFAVGLVLPASTGADETDVRMRTPVIVELFTSEGCSSCPPAERVLAELAKEQPVPGADVVPLAFHVDYWDDLGWADPFARPEFTNRQRAYAKAFQSNQIYTPQMVVGGDVEFSGFKERTARREIEKAAAGPYFPVGLHALPAAEGDDPTLRRFRVDVSPLEWAEAAGAADVVLVLTEDGLASKVLRGENAGRHLEHIGVVRVMTRAGVIEQTEEHTQFETAVKIEAGWNPENLNAVAFVQQHADHRILGAAHASLAALEPKG